MRYALCTLVVTMIIFNFYDRYKSEERINLITNEYIIRLESINKSFTDTVNRIDSRLNSIEDKIGK